MYNEEVPYDKVPEKTNKEYKRNIWNAAIGLQAVDGLEPSPYLKKLAEDNISGHKSYEEVEKELKKEYGDSGSDRQREADIVSNRIAQLLETSKFVMSPNLLLSIHDFLFDGVLDEEITGRFRRYNITKKESILMGDTVIYTDYLSIKSQLDFFIDEESKYRYSIPMTDKDIEHLSEFTRNIWQTHPFGEGNTRTTAVFVEMYLLSLGYDVNNISFKEHSTFYRNALVRSCYSNKGYDVTPTYSFLNHFYKNLLCGANYMLDNYDLIITNKEDINYISDGERSIKCVTYKAYRAEVHVGEIVIFNKDGGKVKEITDPEVVNNINSQENLLTCLKNFYNRYIDTGLSL